MAIKENSDDNGGAPAPLLTEQQAAHIFAQLTHQVQASAQRTQASQGVGTQKSLCS
jgi:hypothetical protein